MVFDKTLPTAKKWNGKNTKNYIILHHTALVDFETCARILSGPKTGPTDKSVHYVVGQKGEVAKIGNDDDILWHVGVSKWQGKTDLNQYSIGIEICSDGTVYTDLQRAKVKELVQYLMGLYKIAPESILRHADVSGFRGKWDVGPNFFLPLTWGQYQDQFRSQKPDKALVQQIMQDNSENWVKLSQFQGTEAARLALHDCNEDLKAFL